MGKNKNKFIYLSLILIIISMMLLIVYLWIENNNYNKKIEELQNNISSMKDTINMIEEEHNIILNEQENAQLDGEEKINNIVLEGIFGIENSDVFYEFNKNGSVESWGNISSMEGTYHTIGKNEVEIRFNKENTYDEEKNENIIRDINIVVKCTMINENNLHIDFENEQISYDIVRIEEN